MKFSLSLHSNGGVQGILKDGDMWVNFAHDDKDALVELIGRLNQGDSLQAIRDYKPLDSLIEAPKAITELIQAHLKSRKTHWDKHKELFNSGKIPHASTPSIELARAALHERFVDELNALLPAQAQVTPPPANS